MNFQLQDTMNRSFGLEHYLDKPLFPLPSHHTNDACFSEEESDSSHSTKSFHKAKLVVNKHKKRETHTDKKEVNTDSDNDSLAEYKAKKGGKKKGVCMEGLGERKQKSLYKTELCRNWEETGQCRYGIKCQYAHGAQDLREIERHPKYKTQKCRTFHKTGACPYGARCTFRHFSLPGDEQEDVPSVLLSATAPRSFFGSPSSVYPHALASWYPKHYAQEEEDLMLYPTAESLLPHQLLFDLDHEHPIPPTLTPTPSANYYQQDNLCKSFLRPWFI